MKLSLLQHFKHFYDWKQTSIYFVQKKAEKNKIKQNIKTTNQTKQVSKGKETKKKWNEKEKQT